MKILYFYPEQDNYMFLWQRKHIVDELEHNGINLEIINPLLYNTFEEAYTVLMSKLKQGSYEIFLTCDTQILHKQILSEIRSLGIPSVCFRPDNLLIPFIDKDWAKDFDLFWLTSVETSYLYKKWGARYIFLPYAANPYAFKPTSAKNIRKIGFVGTPYGSRANMINNLLTGEVPIDVYCKKPIAEIDEGEHFTTRMQPRDISTFTYLLNYISFAEGRRVLLGNLKNKIRKSILEEHSDFLNMKPKVPFLHMLDIYSGYALSLSSTSARNTGVLEKPLTVLNLRSFEIPMCGGLQFCRYCDELASYFEEDKEIVFYRSDEEMVDKAHYYLEKVPDETLSKMKHAARLRAEKEHSWTVRFNKIFQELGLKY